MASELDLQPFCSTEWMREHLRQPWTRDGFTYATNGYIMVRVPARDGVAENPKAPDANRMLFDSGLALAHFQPASVAIPQAPEDAPRDCSKCDGRGLEHSCSYCSHLCTECGGDGLAEASVDIGGTPFNLRYVRMMAALPALELAFPISEREPLLFRFDGGIGALMPRRVKCRTHLGSALKQAA